MLSWLWKLIVEPLGFGRAIVVTTKAMAPCVGASPRYVAVAGASPRFTAAAGVTPRYRAAAGAQARYWAAVGVTPRDTGTTRSFP